MDMDTLETPLLQNGEKWSRRNLRNSTMEGMILRTCVHVQSTKHRNDITVLFVQYPNENPVYINFYYHTR